MIRSLTDESVLLSHPTGNSNVKAVISALEKSGMLAEVNSTFGVSFESNWPKLLPGALQREVLRRTFPISTSKLKIHPFLEVLRMSSHKLGLNYLVRHEYGMASANAVYRQFDRSVARRLPFLVRKRKVKAVYAYEFGALDTFVVAKELGLKCLYELPIAYWETSRRLLEEETQRLPDWGVTLEGGIKDPESNCERKTRELELADGVIVPSKFVLDSLPAWAKGKKVVMSPFGSPELIAGTKRTIIPKVGSRRKLRVLFVGSMGQRKGLGDLFEAISLLNPSDIELVVLGSPLAPMEFYRNKLPDFTFEPSREHNSVLALMRSCDVFCLPSIVEGRALVMQEAMSQGLPIIITPNTGGDDLVLEGRTGFLVPIRSPEAIAEKLTWFSDHRRKIPDMAIQSMQHAASYTWNGYGTTIIEFLKGLIN